MSRVTRPPIPSLKVEVTRQVLLGFGCPNPDVFRTHPFQGLPSSEVCHRVCDLFLCLTPKKGHFSMCDRLRLKSTNHFKNYFNVLIFFFIESRITYRLLVIYVLLHRLTYYRGISTGVNLGG